MVGRITQMDLARRVEIKEQSKSSLVVIGKRLTYSSAQAGFHMSDPIIGPFGTLKFVLSACRILRMTFVIRKNNRTQSPIIYIAIRMAELRSRYLNCTVRLINNK